MKQGDRRYTVNWIQAGQPRAYANSIYKFEVFVEWIPYKGGGTLMTWEPNDLDEDLVDQAVKGIAKKFYRKGDEGSDWASPFLTERIKIGPGRWRYTITEQYND